MTSPHVLVVGGGIGGLCLAHGLRNAGIPVTVFERSHARTDWLQGYRIHINPHGSTALHSCLPADNWQAFLDSVSDGADGFAFVTEQLHDLLVLDPDFIDSGDADPARRHHGVSRIALRQALLAGLDDVVEFGRTFERYRYTGDGRVVAHFADGSSAAGDLLVGADGANSRVRTQLLPHARRVDTGVIAIAGKHALTDRAEARLSRQLTARVNTVLPAGRGFMFTAVWTGDRARTSAARARHEVLPDGFLFDDSDYTFWAYADAAARFPTADRLREMSGGDLIRLVNDRVSTWDSALRHLVSGSDPDTVNVVRVRTATPVRPWATGSVTLLGDAIHNMTPMGGIGANTALRDADLLRRQLVAVQRGERGLVPAVTEYERHMLDYGFDAVRRSLRNAKMAASANPVGRRAFRGVLRIADRVPGLKRLMFGGIGE
jgi:salicylate hydroxylase